MAGCNVFMWISMLVLIVGGLNWGSIGVFNFNFVEYLFGFAAILPKIIYILVGICALFGLGCLFRCKKECSK